jgi:hypothetical protein
LFFYLTDIEGNSADIKVGDEVEFQTTINQRNGKNSAVKIKKLNQTPTTPTVEVSKRPERLITKLRTTNIDDKSGRQLILVRQPRNPDGKTKSFSRTRVERLPGFIVETNLVSHSSSNNLVQLAKLQLQTPTTPTMQLQLQPSEAPTPTSATTPTIHTVSSANNLSHFNNLLMNKSNNSN